MRSPEAASKVPSATVVPPGRRPGSNRKHAPPPPERKEACTTKGGKGVDKWESSAAKSARPAGSGRSSRGTAAGKGGTKECAQDSTRETASAGLSQDGDDLEGLNGGGSAGTPGSRKCKAVALDAMPAPAKRQRGGAARVAAAQRTAESTAATPADEAASQDTGASSGHFASEIGDAGPSNGGGKARTAGITTADTSNPINLPNPLGAPLMKRAH